MEQIGGRGIHQHLTRHLPQFLQEQYIHKFYYNMKWYENHYFYGSGYSRRTGTIDNYLGGYYWSRLRS